MNIRENKIENNNKPAQLQVVVVLQMQRQALKRPLLLSTSGAEMTSNRYNRQQHFLEQQK